jgi:hypothetical protein
VPLWQAMVVIRFRNGATELHRTHGVVIGAQEAAL